MGLAHSWHPSQRAFASDLHRLVHAAPILGWAMDLIPFVTLHPNDTQYCLLSAPSNQTSQGVTHPGTTLTEARLTAEGVTHFGTTLAEACLTAEF
jgi:hypothetical protein